MQDMHTEALRKSCRCADPDLPGPAPVAGLNPVAVIALDAILSAAAGAAALAAGIGLLLAVLAATFGGAALTLAALALIVARAERAPRQPHELAPVRPAGEPAPY